MTMSTPSGAVGGLTLRQKWRIEAIALSLSFHAGVASVRCHLVGSLTHVAKGRSYAGTVGHFGTGSSLWPFLRSL